MKKWKVGQTVVMTANSPWCGKVGTIIDFPKVKVHNRRKPRVEFDNGHKVFIMDDNQADIVR